MRGDVKRRGLSPLLRKLLDLTSLCSSRASRQGYTGFSEERLQRHVAVVELHRKDL